MSSVEPSQSVHPVLHPMSCWRPHPEAETADIWAAGAAAAVAGPVHSGKSGGRHTVLGLQEHKVNQVGVLCNKGCCCFQPWRTSRYPFVMHTSQKILWEVRPDCVPVTQPS